MIKLGALIVPCVYWALVLNEKIKRVPLQLGHISIHWRLLFNDISGNRYNEVKHNAIVLNTEYTN